MASTTNQGTRSGCRRRPYNATLPQHHPCCKHRAKQPPYCHNSRVVAAIDASKRRSTPTMLRRGCGKVGGRASLASTAVRFPLATLTPCCNPCVLQQHHCCDGPSPSTPAVVTGGAALQHDQLLVEEAAVSRPLHRSSGGVDEHCMSASQRHGRCIATPAASATAASQLRRSTTAASHLRWRRRPLHRSSGGVGDRCIAALRHHGRCIAAPVASASASS